MDFWVFFLSLVTYPSLSCRVAEVSLHSVVGAMGELGHGTYYISFPSSLSPFRGCPRRLGPTRLATVLQYPVACSSFSWFVEHGGVEHPGPEAARGYSVMNKIRGATWMKFVLQLCSCMDSIQRPCTTHKPSNDRRHRTCNSRIPTISRISSRVSTGTFISLPHPCERSEST